VGSSLSSIKHFTRNGIGCIPLTAGRLRQPRGSTSRRGQRFRTSSEGPVIVFEVMWFLVEFSLRPTAFGSN
jgi:hypothetical protein